MEVGLRFHPTDHELVAYYLRNKADMGNKFQCAFVSDCPEFYGEKEPWVIWDMHGGYNVEDGEPLFLFTKRNKINPTSTRFDRKVGSGTWSGQYSKEIFAENGATGKPVIGIKREFRYEGGCHSDQNNAWLMQEYELPEDDITVLCTLKKNPRKPPPPPSTAWENNVKKTKRKLDNVVVQDHQLRKKPKAREAKREEIYEAQGSSSVDHQAGSSCSVLPYHHEQEDYRPEFVVPGDLGETVYISVDELLTPTPDDPVHECCCCPSESKKFHDQFFEDNNVNLVGYVGVIDE
jgi:hypothetical protein